MSIDLFKNTITINRIPFHLDSYRWFLLKYYSDLCTNLFIKSIVKFIGNKGVLIRTYDWDKIFEIAKERGYDNVFFEKYRGVSRIIEQNCYDKYGNLFKKGDRVPEDFLNSILKHQQ